MAISSYGKALASMAKESVVGSVKGFASNIKSAAISEMPALSGAVAFARSLRKEADKSNDEVKEEVKKQVKEQKFGNIIGLESAKFLKSINTNTAIQTRLLLQQSKFDRQNRMFAEEETRERLLRDKSLVDAIKKIGGGRGASTADGKSGGGVGSAISDLLGNVLGSVLSGAGLVGGGLLAGRALGLGRSRGATEILGTSKPNPRLSASKVGAIDVKAIGKKILPRLLGALFSGPVGAALIAYSLYELLSGIIGASSSAQGAQFPTSLGLPPNRRSGRQSTPPTSSTDDYLKKVIQVESGGRSNAQASTSSAYGLGQFTKGTFESLAANSPRDSAIYGKSFEDYKKNEELQIEALKALTEQNRTRFVRSGLPTDDASLYLAHFLGAGVAHKVLQSNNNVDLKSVIPTSYFTANPGVFGNLKTVGDLKAWAAKKMGMSGRSTAIPVASSNYVSSSKKETGAETRNRFLSALGGSSTTSNISNAGGGTITPTEKAIPTRDAALIELGREQNKKLDNIRKSSGDVRKIQTDRARAERLRSTRRIETPEQRILRRANEAFLSGFQQITTRKITTALEKALFPKGFGVTAADTRGELFRGQVTSDLLGTEKFFNKALGREYGPLFNQLSKSYLEVGARGAGQFLFGGTAGVDSQALTGQILGNIQKGKKDVALEQLLYGMTGTSSGVETLFAKYGFGSAKEGVGKMGSVLGAGVTDVVRNTFPFIGEVPGTVKIGSTNAVAVFDMSRTPPGTSAAAASSIRGGTIPITGFGSGNPLDLKTQQTTLEINKDVNTVTSEAVVEQNELINAYGEEHSQLQEDNVKATVRGAEINAGATVAAAQSTGNIFTSGINYLARVFQSATGRSGGGTQIGGSSFGSGGQTFGDFAIDLGKTVAINKLTENIKNPYVRAITNFGLNRATDVGIQTVQSGGDLASFGARLANSFLGPNSALTSSYGASLSQQVGSQLLGPFAGTAAAYSAMVPGLTFGSTQAAMLAAQTGVFGPAGLSATAAAGSGAVGAGAAGAGAGASSSFAAFATNPVTLTVLAALVIFGMFGRKKRQPPAVFMHRAIAIFGNSNINAKFTINQNNPPEAYGKIADEMLNVSFNLTKSLEIRTNKQSPFAVVYVMMHQSYIEVDLRDSEHKVVDTKRWGAPHEVNIPTVVKETAVFIGEAFKKHLPAEAEKIEKGVSDLLKKSYRELVGGIEASVSRDLDKALSGAESNEYQKSLQAQSMMAASGYKQPETEYTGGPQYDSEGNLMSQYDSDGNLINVGPAVLTSHKVFDFRTGQMISSKDVGVGFMGRFDQRIIGVDHAGNPIYNVGSEQITAEDFLENLTKNPGAITPVTPAPGTIAPPLASRDDTDYRKSFLDSIGGVNTIVNTSNQTSSTTHVNNSSRSDADPFKVGTSIEAA